MAKQTSFSLSGQIVDVVNRKIIPGKVFVRDGKISAVVEDPMAKGPWIMPGLIDAHVHIESSMLIPSEFARLAVVHGTVGSISDPHEIANVLGLEGIEFMIRNGKKSPFRFYFGAPSCVPATTFESSGAAIGTKDIGSLLQMEEIRYLAEMMNFPGVIHGDKEVTKKIDLAKKYGRVIDGHAPGLTGPELKNYAAAGITTDHECFTKEEALEKIALGMKILIREGSAAKNFDALIGLMANHPESLMLCSDDKHPDDLIKGHINQLVKKALKQGYDLFDVLRSATLNPKVHYGLSNGLLQPGDPADMMVVDNPGDFNVLQTFIEGELAAENGKSFLHAVKEDTPNRFFCKPVSPAQLHVPARSDKIKVIQALDGQLITKTKILSAKTEGEALVSEPERDILKLVALNRYNAGSKPSVAFLNGFGLKKGAIASTVAHDSHNILAVGTNDRDLSRAINLLVENRGGIALANGDKENILPLPVAGIMTHEDGYKTAMLYQKLDKEAKALGSPLAAPFMTLSFMALLVIPELKLSDKGLFDAKSFELTSLYVE